MNWIDWLIVLGVLIAIIIVVRVVQKITAMIATVVVMGLVIALVLYFLTQWSITPDGLVTVIKNSWLGAWLVTMGGWLFNYCLGFVKK